MSGDLCLFCSCSGFEILENPPASLGLSFLVYTAGLLSRVPSGEGEEQKGQCLQHTLFRVSALALLASCALVKHFTAS